MFQLLYLLSVFYSAPVVQSRAAYLRDRPRGLGLLQLPTGTADERTAPFLPGLYIAGNKLERKPQTVPDVHLPGQFAEFSGRSAFNPFTQAVSATYSEDISDSWGSGFAVSGVNALNLAVRRNFDAFADAVSQHDGTYQPFITAFTVGGEYDPSKIREVEGHMDLPIPGVNELFDLDGRGIFKGGGASFTIIELEYPLTLSDPAERGFYAQKHINWASDRHIGFGHVIPNINTFVIPKDKIMSRLIQNRLNPTMIG
ncbi:unnamed protein product [Caenorhabditis auriculariae]|uniref:Peptidase A1 domain-containing protein n=1 Tax=Caenorhabditis auriculariae TaxID=2777116 RepID=A0A8S1H8E8_9PELO|nr:unnamed protein product [Caenorhabditis auriculariae]